MGKKLTQEEVQQKLDNNFKQKVTLVSEYVNRRTKIKIRCEKCGHEWEAMPTSVLYDDFQHRCPNCGVAKKEKFNCAYCGKEIYRVPSQIARNKTGLFYCSQRCGNLHKNQIRKENGEWDNSLNYRLRAFENYEHKCAICGWCEDERVLEVHHIDEDRSHNQLENLIILCPICHKKLTLHLYQLVERKRLVDVNMLI